MEKARWQTRHDFVMKVQEDARSGLSQVVTHSKSEHSGLPILFPHAIVPDTEPRASDFPLSR